MKVLLVSYSFPPAAGVGVLRALSLAKYLPENGVHVDVLTALNAAAVGKDTTLLAQLPVGQVEVHRTWTLDLPFALRKAIKKLITREATKTMVAKKANAGPAKPNRLKVLVGNLLLPDPQVGWLPFAVPAARRLIRKHKIDVVLITVPPFSSVRMATKLRKSFPELAIVVDFRDEWLTSTLQLVSFNSNQRARNTAARAEREAVRDASEVVCVTEAAVAELRRRYPGEPSAKFQCIPNGFDTVGETGRAESVTELVANASAALTVLTYIGTVYGSTDPTPVVEAILELPAEVRARLRLRFIGHIETPAYRETLLRLGDQVELIGFLPQAKALSYIAQTTYLLLITHDPINVAAKLYDYLGSGRPILAAVHPTGDVRRILDQTHAGWWADIGDVKAIGRLLMDGVARTGTLDTEFTPDRKEIAAYHRRPLAARYAELLRRAVLGRPAG